MRLEPDDYIALPAIVIGGDLHGSVVEPGRASIQLVQYKEPLSAGLFVDDPRPFIRPIPTQIKTIPLERISFVMTFAVDDSDGTTKEQVLGHLNGMIRDIQGRLMDEVYYQSQVRKENKRHMLGEWREAKDRPKILDRITWANNFLSKFFPKKPSKHWELN